MSCRLKKAHKTNIYEEGWPNPELNLGEVKDPGRELGIPVLKSLTRFLAKCSWLNPKLSAATIIKDLVEEVWKINWPEAMYDYTYMCMGISEV